MKNEVIPMNVQEAISNRLSIRQYAETSIPSEHMETIFKALQLAASANNQQNWEFVFVGDPELKKKLVPACMNQRFVGDCSYFIAGVVDPKLKWHMVDITIAYTNLTLQAVELGYGTCWIGAFDETKIKELLEIPESKKIVACMTFGKPKGRHVSKSRKNVENFVYLDRFSNNWSWK
jgi:nitroreductase